MSEAVNAGQTATSTAAASGTPSAATVQWQVSTNGGSTFANVAGATSTTLSIVTTAGQSGNEYRAVFTNSFGSATTTAATMTVVSAPVVSTIPVDETVDGGQTATLTAAASGNPGADGAVAGELRRRVQLRRLGRGNVDHVDFAASAVQDGEEYRAVFTNSLGSRTTDAATLTVDARLW